jgi:hypothetical protein
MGAGYQGEYVGGGVPHDAAGCAAFMRPRCDPSWQLRPFMQSFDGGARNQSVASFLIARGPVAFLGSGWESGNDVRGSAPRERMPAASSCANNVIPPLARLRRPSTRPSSTVWASRRGRAPRRPRASSRGRGRTGRSRSTATPSSPSCPRRSAPPRAGREETRSACVGLHLVRAAAAGTPPPLARFECALTSTCQRGRARPTPRPASVRKIERSEAARAGRRPRADDSGNAQSNGGPT